MPKQFLIKPAIFLQPHVNESPIYYLLRLANGNACVAISWLINKGPIGITSNLAGKLQLFEDSHWIQSKNFGVFVTAISRLPSRYLIKRPKFCPHCLEEGSSWKAVWHLRGSQACLKHKVWLLKTCSRCGDTPSLKPEDYNLCSSKCNLAANKTERCPPVIIQMQRYIEEDFTNNDTSQISISSKLWGLPLEQKLRSLHTFARLQPSESALKTGLEVRLYESKTIAVQVANSLLGGEAGFIHLIERAHRQAENTNPSHRLTDFVKFYRKFYQNCNESVFKEHKLMLEKFINNNYSLPVTKRNQFFMEQTIENHPWIAIKQASSLFNLPKIKIMDAIAEKTIRVKVLQKEKRAFTLVRSEDVKLVEQLEQDIVTSAEAARLLGVTKEQFKQIRSCNVFNHVVPPAHGRRSPWRFSKREIIQFLRKLREKDSDRQHKYLSIPVILKRYAAQIENPLSSILRALKLKQLEAFSFCDGPGLRGVAIDEHQFKTWLTNNKITAGQLSVPEVAKIMKLNQQFTYQLVKSGLLQSKKVNNNRIIITHKNIDYFNAEYYLLARLAKSLSMGSKMVMKQLEILSIFPVEPSDGETLRQVVYRKKEVDIVVNRFEQSTMPL
jgi:hypothetical protein